MKTIVLMLVMVLCFVQSSAQEITMFSGFFDYQYYQDDKRIARKDLVNLLETNQEALAYWNRSKTFNTLSWLALASEIGFGIWYITDNKESNNAISQVGLFGSFAAALTFSFISHSQKKKAILKYNQGIEEKTAFKIYPSKKGIGVAIVF
ncbi:MAG: hypothetical protein AAGF77_11140 [Bacteroidota bacterium]